MERTSKRYKTLQATGFLLIVWAIGCGLWLQHSQQLSAVIESLSFIVLSLLFFIGIGLLGLGLVLAWWHHG